MMAKHAFSRISVQTLNVCRTSIVEKQPEEYASTNRQSSHYSKSHQVVTGDNTVHCSDIEQIKVKESKGAHIIRNCSRPRHSIILLHLRKYLNKTQQNFEFLRAKPL